MLVHFITFPLPCVMRFSFSLRVGGALKGTFTSFDSIYLVVNFHPFTFFTWWIFKRIPKPHNKKAKPSNIYVGYLRVYRWNCTDKITYCFFGNLLLDHCLPSFRIDCSTIQMQLYRNNWRRLCYGAFVRLWLQNPWWFRYCFDSIRGRCFRVCVRITVTEYFAQIRLSLGPKWCHKKCFRFFAFCFVWF